MNKWIKLILLCVPLLFNACEQNNATQDIDQEDTLITPPDTAMPDTIPPDGTQNVPPKMDTIISDTITEGPKPDEAKADPEFIKLYHLLAVALEKGDHKTIDKYVHPKLGFYYIHRPGAFDNIDTAMNSASLYKKLYKAKERFKKMDCSPEERAIPKITCDHEYTGCFTEPIASYDRISKLKPVLVEYEIIKSFPEAEKKHAKSLEKHVKRRVVNFDTAIGIDFMRIDGRWYIGVIDFAKYSCSA